MVAGKGSEAAAMNQTTLELQGECGDRHRPHVQRTGAPRVRRVHQARARAALVGARARVGCRSTSCDADVRVGGGYRYVLRLKTGQLMAFSGTYSEVTPPTRLVYTEIFEPTAAGANPGDPALVVTVTFDEENGRTHLVSRSLCPSKDVRDAILATGMEHGMRETMDQLEALVATLA